MVITLILKIKALANLAAIKSALKDSSGILRSYILLDFIFTPSGFRGAAFQNPKTGEIVFSFRGTDFKSSDIRTYIETYKDIANADKQIYTRIYKFLYSF